MEALLPSLARLRLAATGGALPSKALANDDEEPPPLPPAPPLRRELPPPLPRREGDADAPEGPRPPWLPPHLAVQDRRNPAPVPRDNQQERARGMQSRLRGAAFDEVERGEEEEEEEENCFDNGGGEETESEEEENEQPTRRTRADGSRAAGMEAMNAARRRLEASDVDVNVYTLSEIRRTEHQWLRFEAKELVRKDVYVKYGKNGPDRQLSKRFDNGLTLPHGWLVIATLKENEEELDKDAVVGVMLVGADAKRWKYADRNGRPTQVLTLGVHHLFEGNYIPDAMWGAMLDAIQNHPEAGQRRFSLHVTAGSCLNNDAARRLYRRWGFQGVGDDARGDGPMGWHLNFVDGEPEEEEEE